MPGMGGGGMFGMLMGGGRGGMGGMNPPGGQAQTPAQPPLSEYDVDRWKRADDLDVVSTPTIQEVKKDWAERDKAKRKDIRRQERVNNEQYLNQTRVKSEQEQREEDDRVDAPLRGTVVTPEMKKAQRRIGVQESEPAAVPLSVGKEKERHADRNYLGLKTHAGIDGFFTSNPSNSLFLAVDTLSMTPLSLDQAAFNGFGRDMRKPRNEQNEASGEFMKSVHESRKARKYDVRIV